MVEGAELLKALAHPGRLRIVLELAEGERCVHELVEATGSPQPLVSQQLRVLRSARVIAGRRDGREVRYSIADDHIAHIAIDTVAHIREDRP